MGSSLAGDLSPTASLAMGLWVTLEGLVGLALLPWVALLPFPGTGASAGALMPEMLLAGHSCPADRLNEIEVSSRSEIFPYVEHCLPIPFFFSGEGLTCTFRGRPPFLW